MHSEDARDAKQKAVKPLSNVTCGGNLLVFANSRLRQEKVTENVLADNPIGECQPVRVGCQVPTGKTVELLLRKASTQKIERQRVRVKKQVLFTGANEQYGRSTGCSTLNHLILILFESISMDGMQRQNSADKAKCGRHNC